MAAIAGALNVQLEKVEIRATNSLITIKDKKTGKISEIHVSDIKDSSRFQLGVQGYYNQDRDFISEMKNTLLDLSQEQEIKLLSFKNYMSKSAASYEKDVLQVAFGVMDNILKGDSDE